MANFTLYDLNPEFWTRVQAKAAADGTTVKAVILKLLTAWLGVVAILVLSGCSASPLAPSAPIVSVPLIPASIAMTGGTATKADQVLFNLLVTDATGKGVSGIAVTLTTTAGTFDRPGTVTTGMDGKAQSLLTTTTDATVTATAGALTTSAQALKFPVPPPPPTCDTDPSVCPAPPPPPPPPSCATDSTLCPPPPPPPPPTLSVALTCTPALHATPTPCNVNVSWGSAPLLATTITKVEWNWGDGSTSTTVPPTAPISSHNYISAGTFTIAVTVTATTPDGTKTATAARSFLIL
jgi:hypothetical protein